MLKRKFTTFSSNDLKLICMTFFLEEFGSLFLCFLTSLVRFFNVCSYLFLHFAIGFRKSVQRTVFQKYCGLFRCNFANLNYAVMFF